jgi:hypothetical protein
VEGINYRGVMPWDELAATTMASGTPLRASLLRSGRRSAILIFNHNGELGNSGDWRLPDSFGDADDRGLMSEPVLALLFSWQYRHTPRLSDSPFSPGC